MEDSKEGRRKAMKDYTSHKVIFSIIGGFMLDIFGGWDNLLAFLVMLVVADTISGVFKAIKNKELSSEAMRIGLFKKAMIALICAIAVQADKVV
jgi:toxin secretion/phage lysis holin